MELSSIVAAYTTELFSLLKRPLNRTKCNFAKAGERGSAVESFNQPAD